MALTFKEQHNLAIGEYIKDIHDYVYVGAVNFAKDFIKEEVSVDATTHPLAASYLSKMHNYSVRIANTRWHDPSTAIGPIQYVMVTLLNDFMPTITISDLTSSDFGNFIQANLDLLRTMIRLSFEILTGVKPEERTEYESLLTP